MTRNPLARTRDLIRERWKTSEWAGSTSTDVVWYLGTWLVLLAFAVFVACFFIGFVCLNSVVAWRTVAATALGVILIRVGRQTLRSEVDSLRDQLHWAAVHYDVTTNSYARDLLAEGPITGETPAVELFDQDAPALADEVPA